MDTFNDQFFSRLFRQLPDIYYIYHSVSGAVYWSENVEHVLGFDRKELQRDPMKWTHAVHEDDKPKIIELIESLQPGESFDLEYRIRDESGRQKWLRDRSIHIDEEGEGVVIEGWVVDITEQKDSEQRIRESLEDLELAQRIAKIGNWQYDPEQSHPVWSEEVYRIYERSPDMGPHSVEEYEKVYGPEQYQIFSKAFLAARDEGTPYDIHLELHTPSGIKKYIHAICEPSQERGPAGYFLRGTIQDVTAEVIAYQELESARQEMEKLNKEKDLMLSVISHDLRSPFQSMLGLSKKLDREYEEFDPERRKKVIKLIADQLAVTYSLTENLLAWANLQRHSVAYNPEVIDLHEVLKEVRDFYSRIALQKNVKIQFEGESTLKVWADREMLRIVFRNLISNAIKYSLDGGSVIVSFQREKVKEGEMAALTVEDHGLGMSTEQLSAIFDFEPVKSVPGTSEEQGSGVGLMLCREFTDRNGGRISASSRKGEGSSFKVWLQLHTG